MKTLLTLLCCLGQVRPGSAQELSPEQIWAQTMAKHGQIAFRGDKRLSVTRGDEHFMGKVHTEYADSEHFALTIEAPGVTRTPLGFGVDAGRSWASFPDEGLFFHNGAPETRLFAAQLLLDQLPSWPQRVSPTAYGLRRLPDAIVALTPCYRIEFMPSNGLSRPRLNYWIARDSFQILRSSRSRDYHDQPGYETLNYAESEYTLFRPLEASQPPAVAPPHVSGGIQVDLQQSFGNAFRTYPDPESAARAEKLRIYQPAWLPEGFALQQVQLLRVFGVPIQILNYSDGLNLLSVAAQPQIELSSLIFSGLVNLNYFAITRRMVSLKPYAPYDYYSRFTPGYQTIVFGDLDWNSLRRVSESLPVP
ncbi:MAG: hypothetical protein ACAI44_38850 [Candidatus Sericytochromatia bacterium]